MMKHFRLLTANQNLISDVLQPRKMTAPFPSVQGDQLLVEEAIAFLGEKAAVREERSPFILSYKLAE
jgi:hypothetical protein